MVSYLDDFEDFTKAYNSGLKRSEIMFKFGWSERVYRFAYYKGLRDGLIKSRGSAARVPKFYFFDAGHGRWIVRGKSVEGKFISITCPSEASANQVVDLLFDYGWCKSSVARIKSEVGL